MGLLLQYLCQINTNNFLTFTQISDNNHIIDTMKFLYIL